MTLTAGGGTELRAGELSRVPQGHTTLRPEPPETCWTPHDAGEN